jgi:hypothetical protein
METVKLINKNGDIIERLKIQYEPNIKIWNERGWSVYEKPKAQPKIEQLKTTTKSKKKAK